MVMQITIKGARGLGSGVWMADLNARDLNVFKGRSEIRGRRSIILVDSEVYEDEDRLEFDPLSATVLNIGSGSEAVIIASGSKIEDQNIEKNFPGPSDFEDQAVYWVTVGKKLQGNYWIGLKNSIWGVPEGSEARINGVQIGDFILFYGSEIGCSLCEVQSKPFTDTSTIWPDGIYPRRVRISDPIQTNENIRFSEVSDCLIDQKGRRYQSRQGAGRSIGGRAGIFRILHDREISCLFQKLGWEKL